MPDQSLSSSLDVPSATQWDEAPSYSKDEGPQVASILVLRRPLTDRSDEALFDSKDQDFSSIPEPAYSVTSESTSLSAEVKSAV